MNNDISDECVLDCNEENVGTLARKSPLDSVKKRYDLHSILFKENGLLDGSVLTYISKKERILEGYKKGNYIVCSCCNGEVSPSIFESHAGFASRRQPYRNIYTSSGLTLHELSLSLLGCQNKRNTLNMDTKCMICSDGGLLLCCTGCLKTFHGECLDLQEVFVPVEGWLCPYCIDRTSSSDVSSSDSRIRRIFFQVPTSNIDGCVICRKSHYSVGVLNSDTMTICCQCQKEYHAGCLKERGICDFEVSEDNWFCCNDCCIIHNQLTKMICKKYFPYLNNPTMRQDMHWCILSGEDRSLENRSLLSKAAAIFREAFHPIPGSCVDIVPAMLFGKSDKDHDFFGTYCAIVMIESKVISAGMLRVFGTDIAELSLVATTKLSRRQGYFRSLFSLVEVLLTKLKVKKLILPANENVNSMWVEKFGFSVMAGSELNRYVSEIPITLFQGVLMLEKSFQISSNAITYKYTISSSIITN